MGCIEVPFRHKVAALEAALRQQTPEELGAFQDAIETTNIQDVKGILCRVVKRRKGVVIVGKVHKQEHLYIIAKGSVAVTNGDEPPIVYTAGDIVVSKPGTKRAVVALEDSVCMTVHRTDKTDLDEIEAELIEPDPLSLFDAHNRLKFDALVFRSLTARVIAAEKPGFWSDWTPEQQELYRSGDWRAFSESRGYSAEAINDYAAWMDTIKRAQDAGIDPYPSIADLAVRAAARNVGMDTRGEILLSSHLPYESREEVA